MQLSSLGRLLSIATLLLCLEFHFCATADHIQNHLPVYDAHQRPLQPFEDSSKGPNPRERRVAVIGAGPAGSSAAYFLRNYSTLAAIPLSITVYDKNDYVGGRSTTVNVYGDPKQPVELGASIFVQANKILVDASRDFGLGTYSGLRPRSCRDDYKTGNDLTYDDGEVLGIYNGREFLFTQTETSSEKRPKNPLEGWWNTAKLLWRYGVIRPVRTKLLVQRFISTFLQMYDPPHFPFMNLTATVQGIGLGEEVAMTARELVDVNELSTTSINDTVVRSSRISGTANRWLTSIQRVVDAILLRPKQVTPSFADEIMQAATRVNYASNLDQLHGVAGMVCLAAEGGRAVQGGNWQIFERMVKRSHATLRLSSAVESISINKNSSTGDAKYVVSARKPSTSNHDETGDNGNIETIDHQMYDDVIIAAPFHQTGIRFPQSILQHTPADDPYTTLHVTLFASPFRLSPTFFNQSSTSASSLSPNTGDDHSPLLSPDDVLTTLPSMSSGMDFPHHDGSAFAPPFFSISTIRTEVSDPKADAQHLERVYKIFSSQPVSNHFIASLIERPCTLAAEDSNADPRRGPPVDLGEQHNCSLSNDDVSWMHRKTWKSYPKLRPRKTFEPLRIDNQPNDKGGIWYTAGIEAFISTMETSALMGRNVAMLIIDRGAT